MASTSSTAWSCCALSPGDGARAPFPALEPSQREPVSNGDAQQSEIPYDNQGLTEMDRRLVQVKRLDRARALSQRAREPDHPHPEGRHGEGGSDPRKGRPLESELRAVLRHRGSSGGEIDSGIVLVSRPPRAWARSAAATGLT